MVTREEARFAFEGLGIHYLIWPAANPRGIVQIMHGVGEYAARYEQLGQALAAAGWSAYAADHLGHGETWREQWGGDPAKLGRLGPGGVRRAIRAQRAFGEMLRAEYGDLPLVLFGHSLGSLFAQKMIDEDASAYSGVVLSASALRTLRDMNGGDLNARHAHLGPTTAEWLSRDRAVVDAFAADPLTTDRSVMSLFGVVDALRLLGTPRRAVVGDPPMLLQVGDDDSLGGVDSVEKLAAAYRSHGQLTDVRVIVYPGARHEIYNETNQAEVRDDLLDWLERHVLA